MKPLVILLIGFGTSLLILKLVTGGWQTALAGCIAMSMMLMFTAIGHFAFSKGMKMMIPDFIPFKKAMVYVTGLIEIAAAIGLLVTSLRHITGILLIIFFLLILPANISASLKTVNYQKGSYDGPGKAYLWFRIPLQLLFIAWVYWLAVKDSY